VVTVSPFRGLRYDVAVAGPALQTSAPAYDELDQVDVARHRTANPHTVLELLSGEGASGPDAHAAARATLVRWLRSGVLVPDAPESLYLYDQMVDEQVVDEQVVDEQAVDEQAVDEQAVAQPAASRHGRIHSGLIAAVDLADIDDGKLLLHEHVDPDRAALRAERLVQVPIDVTPVLAVHDGGLGADLTQLMAQVRARRPVVSFDDDHGTGHRLWQISDPDEITTIREAYRPVVALLADGHHRVEAARVLERARPGGARSRTLVWMVDDSTAGPELHAVHRLLPAPPPTDVAGHPVVPGFDAVRWEPGPMPLGEALAGEDEGEAGVAVGLVTASGAWVLRPADGAARDAAIADGGPLVGQLDAQVVDSAVLRPLGEAGAEAVFDADATAAHLRAGTVAGALLVLQPPSLAQVLAIAAAGHRMPAKSTWFRPKPRAGLVMRQVGDVDVRSDHLWSTVRGR
jgi:uncharacterized protein (DUF1015 family)